MKKQSFKILTVFGTRPEVIKLFPVLEALSHEADLKSKTVCTAQHREMIDDLLTLFAIQPDHDLNIIQPKQTLSEMSRRVLKLLSPILVQEKPDMVLVQGDTTSALMGALSAFYQKIPLGHIEAGLRSFNKMHPFPEEANRTMISAMADLHFAPTAVNAQNLGDAGILPEQIIITGNTVIDALKIIAGRSTGRLATYLPLQALLSKKLILVTAHRRENWGAPLENLCRGIRELVECHEDIEIVYPVHLNPRVRDTVFKLLDQVPRVHLLPPLPYEACIEAMQKATLIITDSGGIQEEALTFAKPTLVFREVTERKEGVASGGVKLLGLSRKKLVEEVSRLLTDPKAYARMKAPFNPYGDGKAAERIVQMLLSYFGKRGRPEAFQLPDVRYRRAS